MNISNGQTNFLSKHLAWKPTSGNRQLRTVNCKPVCICSLCLFAQLPWSPSAMTAVSLSASISLSLCLPFEVVFAAFLIICTQKAATKAIRHLYWWLVVDFSGPPRIWFRNQDCQIRPRRSQDQNTDADAHSFSGCVRKFHQLVQKFKCK